MPDLTAALDEASKNVLLSPLVDRMHGCIKLGAIGDAYGYVIEFDDIYKIFNQHKGHMQFDDLAAWQDSFGRIIASDDTQMTLFTAEGITAAYDRRNEPGDLGKITVSEVRQAYLRWYETQRHGSKSTGEDGTLMGWMPSGMLAYISSRLFHRALGCTKP